MSDTIAIAALDPLAPVVLESTVPAVPDSPVSGSVEEDTKSVHPSPEQEESDHVESDHTEEPDESESYESAMLDDISSHPSDEDKMNEVAAYSESIKFSTPEVQFTPTRNQKSFVHSSPTIKLASAIVQLNLNIPKQKKCVVLTEEAHKKYYFQATRCRPTPPAHATVKKMSTMTTD